MQITIENLNRLRIINFYLPQNVADSGVLVVQKTATPENLLPDWILQISGTTRCLIAENTVSVQYIPEMYENIRLLILAELDDFMTEPQIIKTHKNELSLKEQAEALADAFIRPTLNRDNGDIEIHDAANGVIELSFTGHCAGCPYAQNTLQNVIMRTFQKYMPQITDIKVKGA